MTMLAKYEGLSELPEAKELKEVFINRGYELEDNDNFKVVLRKNGIDVSLVSEEDGLKMRVDDHGYGAEQVKNEHERVASLEIATEIVLRHGHRKIKHPNIFCK